MSLLRTKNIFFISLKAAIILLFQRYYKNLNTYFLTFMQKFLFPVLWLLALNGYANHLPQKKIERRPPQWDTLFYKNEFSLDTRMAAIFFLNPTTDFGVFGATYLRALTKKDFIRISTRHQLEGFYEQFNNLRELDFAAPNFTRDSLIKITSRWYNYYSPDIRVGYEHRFGKRRVKAIIGIDILMGVEIINEDFHYTYYETGKISYPTGQSLLVLKQTERGLANGYIRTTNFKLGAAPFVGMFIHFSRRWSGRILAMYDLFWSRNIDFKTNNSARFPPAPDAFNLNIPRGIVGEIGINVHF
jgi:hypothetical protein